MADGTIKIDIDIPVNKVKTDSQAVNDELERIGKNTGKDMDSSFKSNADKVKRDAKATGEAIDKGLGKEHKTKITANNDQAKKATKEAKDDLDKLPKEKNTKLGANNSEIKEKANQAKNDVDKVPKKHDTEFKGNNEDANRKADQTKQKTNSVPKEHTTVFKGKDDTGGIFSRIKAHFDGINSAGGHTHSLFSSIFSANIVSNAFMNGFSAVKSALGGMYGAAKQYALEQQTMNATWLTLTNNAHKGQQMVNQINRMAVAAQNSVSMVDQLSQKFYAINNNAKQTGQLTKSILTLQDAFGQTDAAVENFGTQFSQMMANGKVSAQDMMSIVNVFPKLRPMLLDYERRIHHNSNMTMAEMNKLMSAGKIKSQDMINVVIDAGHKFNKATGNFTKTIPGMTRVVQSQMPTLLGAITKPFAKMESPVYGAVARWVSSKKTVGIFEQLGKTVSRGMNKVVNALAGGRSVNMTKALNGALEGLNNTLKGIFSFLAHNAQPLKDIVIDTGKIAVLIGKSVWKDFAAIITDIGKMFGITAKNSHGANGAISTIATALDRLAKNRAAIHAIATAIVTMSIAKGVDHTAAGIFGIGEKAVGAYKKIKAFRGGLKGIEDAKILKNLSDQEKSWYNLGKSITGAKNKLGGFIGKIKDFVKSEKGMKAGKITGAVGTALVAGGQVVRAVQDRHSATNRSKDIGGAVGAVAGGALTSMIPVVGPWLAPIGAEIGKYAGRFGGEFVDKFTKGWQRKKPPKNKWSIENLGWSAHSMWKGFTKSVSDTIKWFKKHWKEVGLYFVSPLAGAINSLYKHNKKFHKWVNGLVKGFKSAWHGIGKWFGNIGKDIMHAWHGMGSWFKKLGHSMAKGLTSSWHGIVKFFTTIAKNVRAGWRTMTSWFSHLGRNMANGIKSAWRGITSFFSRIVKAIKGPWNGITRWFGSLGSDVVKGFKSAWRGIVSWFKGIINGIKDAWDDFWDAVSGPIKFIAKVFTGKAKLGSLHFANGTDWRRKYGTPAILNDGTDSPQTHNRESIIHRGGIWELLPDIPNLKRWLLPDDEVVNARDTAKIAAQFGNTVHYANGTTDFANITLDLPKSTKDILKNILHVNDKAYDLTTTEVIRRHKRELESDERHRKNDKKKDEKDRRQTRSYLVTRSVESTQKPNVGHVISQFTETKSIKQPTKRKIHYSIDNTKRKGDVLVDKALLTGGLKETGKETWINEKLFNRLMSYTKAKPIKISKNSRIRYRAIPTRSAGKGEVKVDSSWLTGAKKMSGRWETISKEDFAKLLQFTKKRRKYKLPKKKRKRKKTKNKKKKSTRSRSTSRRRTTTRRRTSTRRRSTSLASSLSSLTLSTRSVGSKVVASVKGTKAVKALSKALKGIKGTKKVTIKATAKGAKAVKSLAKTIKKIKSSKHKVTVKTAGRNSLKKLRKAANSIKGSTHKVTVKTAGTSDLNKLRKAISRVADESTKAASTIKGKGNFAKTIEKLTKESIKNFNTLNKDLNKTANSTNKSVDTSFNKMQKSVVSSMRDIKNGVIKNAKSSEQGFQKALKQLIGDAREDMQGTIKQLNRGISGINTVLKQFGGNKEVIKAAHFATGTDANGRLTHDTLAVVNDSTTGPRQEAVVTDKNDIIIPKGNNRTMMLKAGWGVLNGTQTASLGLPHFAKGSGVSHSALRKLAEKSLDHYADAFNKEFTKNVEETGKDVQKDFTGLAKKGSTKYGNPWSQAMWQVINDAIGSGGAGGTREAFLKYAEKEFAGVPYKMATASKTLSDCSGMVMQALRHFNIDIGRDTVSMAHSSGTEYLGKSLSKTLPGDLVIFGHGTGAAGHVGIIKDPARGTMFNETPPYARVTKIASDTGMGYGFYRIKGLHNAVKKHGKKASKDLMKLAKEELGAKALKWIKDNLGEDGLVGAFKLAGDVGDRARAIAKALKKAVPGATRQGLAAIIGAWMFESGLNPVSINPDGGASGFGQWTHTGGRKERLFAYAKRHGKSWRNPAIQLGFALHGDTGKTGLFRHVLTGHGSLSSLAYLFSRRWEAGGYDSQHAADAKRVYAMLRGYASGGIVSSPQVVKVGEGNGPESIIPWDPAQRSRALEIMAATLNQFKAQDGNAQQYQNQAQQVVDLSQTNEEIQTINDKFDSVLAQLGVLANKDQIIQLTNVLNKREVGEAMYEVTTKMVQRQVRNEAHRISGH